METYHIECPICQDTIPVELEDYEVVYYIESYKSNPQQLLSWSSPDPDEKVGRELLVSPDWVTNRNHQCDNDHYLILYSCHYEHIGQSDDRIYGPAQEVKLFCPNCSYRLGDHEDHIVRLDSDLSMQYVLRTIDLAPNENYKQTDAITMSKAGTFDQLSITHQCPHCGESLYYNYSNRRVNQSEAYQSTSSVR